MKKLLQWLMTPVVQVYVKTLEADAKAESERAELWRLKAVTSEEREVVYRRNIKEMQAQHTLDIAAERQRVACLCGKPPSAQVVTGADGVTRAVQP